MPAAVPAETSLQLNFFRAVATLEGLRPLLESSECTARRGGFLDSVVSARSIRDSWTLV